MPQNDTEFSLLTLGPFVLQHINLSTAGIAAVVLLALFYQHMLHKWLHTDTNNVYGLHLRNILGVSVNNNKINKNKQ